VTTKVHAYYVYIIECNDGTLYVGVTNDIERRYAEHRDGLDPDSYTSKRRPVRLAYFEIFQWITDAIKREKQLKGWSAPKKRALMKRDEQVLHDLATCKNPTTHADFSPDGSTS
jgi:putative endonuclease